MNAWKDGSILHIDSPNSLAADETWYVIPALLKDVPW